MSIEFFTFGNVVSKPMVSLKVNILDEQGIKGVDVSDEKVPIALQLRFNLMKNAFLSGT